MREKISHMVMPSVLTPPSSALLRFDLRCLLRLRPGRPRRRPNRLHALSRPLHLRPVSPLATDGHRLAVAEKDEHRGLSGVHNGTQASDSKQGAP